MSDETAGAAIRTPDQRLRVFVSSTLAELAEERAAVARAISALRLTPVMFELGARPHPPRELYRAYLAQSDIFVGLYWQRYGWIGPGMEISGLEDELQLSGSMPRLLYVKRPATEREARLSAMIEQIQSDGTDSYRSFQTPRELGRLVRDDLAVLLSERFAAQRPTGGTMTTSPGASAAPRPPRSLPVTSTSLFGREHDVDRVAELLESPDVRLVTLTGPGGIGKTRLAVAVGERLEGRYPQGTTFVPLASITQPELVLPRIVNAVGASIEGSRPAIDAVVEHLAGTPTLLVLDNLEQVVSVAPELDELLARCPDLEILTTSRTVLRLRAEHEYPVAPLTVPALPSRPPIEQIASSPAVELFVDRARAVRPDFALTDDNLVAVAEICRRLDGVPLAIELAAARIRLLEPAALLARLGSRLDALGTGPVDLPERQRTLRATIEWSVGLLDDAERNLLVTLSVFVDGWTAEAAVQVAGLTDDETLDLLDTLAGHSLVHLVASDAGPRFGMLETVRDFAIELLTASPDVAEVERRHAEHFRRLVEEADWPLQAQSSWAEHLQAEEGNVRVAIRWFMAHDVAPLPRIFRILWLFWQLRDHMAEGRAWVEELLPRAAELDDQGRAELLVASAMTALETGDDAGALAAADGLERQGLVDDPYLGSAAQMMLSWTLPIVDDLDGALRAAEASLQGFRQQDEEYLAAFALLTLGILEMVAGRHDPAQVHLTDVAHLGDQAGNDWFASGARVQLALLAIETGRFDEARSLLEEVLHLTGGAGLGTHTVAYYLVACAGLSLAQDHPRQAALAMGAADGLRRRAGLRVWPSQRRGEAELLAQVEQALEPDVFEQAFATGAELNRREAIAAVRHDVASEALP